MPNLSMESAATKPVEILVVDDSPEDIRLIRDAFALWKRSRHLQVLMSGMQVMEGLTTDKWQPHLAKPDLILLDWNLPGTSGEDVLEGLKKNPHFRTIPVVIFTSSSAPGDRSRAIELGAARFITKPLDLDDFFNVITGLEDFLNTIPECGQSSSGR
jgi:chemotaxis family two-component system response regulator Rcp1